MDALSAADALLIVNLAQAVFIHFHGSHRAALHTGSLDLHDGRVSAGIRALSAGFALGRINIGTTVANSDRAEVTCLLTGLRQAALAQVRYHIAGGNRAFLAGRVDHLNHVRAFLRARAFSFRQSYSLSDNLALFVNTAAETGSGSRNHIKRNIILLFIQLTGKSQLRHFRKHLVLDIQNGSIIRYSRHILCLSSFLFDRPMFTGYNGRENLPCIHGSSQRSRSLAVTRQMSPRANTAAACRAIV